MEILYSNVGTTKPCEYIFMELKFNDILVVFHNEKILVQMLNICVFKMGLLKWFMKIWKKLLGLINDNKLHLQDALLLDLYPMVRAHFVINANNSCIFVHLTKYLFCESKVSPLTMIDIMCTIELITFHLEIP